ncbi:hypothetical protein H8356DRAFT_1427751 [Neocallimastix lanati (nom. inval.)]|nr:hypothetical protein H8356DRAFT_1427751 [Neocallimastix sp. JGI-2020a]
MINCHTGTAKETPYRSTLRDPRGKAEPTIGAGHCKSSQTRLTQWDSYSVRNIENLERKNREDMILVGVDPETFGMISQRLFYSYYKMRIIIFFPRTLPYMNNVHKSLFDVCSLFL